MAKKLLEMNGAEMAAALVSIAAPIKNFLQDGDFMDTFKERTKDAWQEQIAPFFTQLGLSA